MRRYRAAVRRFMWTYRYGTRVRMQAVPLYSRTFQAHKAVWDEIAD